MLTAFSCTCGSYSCNCRWRSETAVEPYAAAAWTPTEHQTFTAYVPPTQPVLSHQPQAYDPATLSAEDIFHPEEIFQLDQPIRLDFPIEENTLESTPTFMDLNNDNSRPEDAYWLDWQRAASCSESSHTPSPELYGNQYQTAESYCDQLSSVQQPYYPEEAQYYIEQVKDSSTQDQRYYRYGASCQSDQNNLGMQWNYADCAFNTQEVPECKQYYEGHSSQTEQTFNSLL